MHPCIQKYLFRRTTDPADALTSLSLQIVKYTAILQKQLLKVQLVDIFQHIGVDFVILLP